MKPPVNWRAATTLFCALVLHLNIAALAAQETATPSQRWRTTETEHFVVHFPESYREWTMEMVSRLESTFESVTALVGFVPEERVTVIVDDPLSATNGYAMPGPLIFLYPTPPDPRSALGDNRSWPELLTVHEFAHIAHIGRPSRSGRSRLLNFFLPVQVGPIATSPRWIKEGYATYIEGQLTGSGRPNGLWRPTLLRQLARQGALPTYSQLDATSGFYRGSMAYIAGSAFLEWLAQKEGDSSLVNLWRRMTARTPRSFNAAFAGVYGGTPAELYGRFSAELTASAMTTEGRVESDGRVEGDLFQKFSWYTGDPALSPSGNELSLAVRSRTAPTRIVVLRTADDSVTDAARRAAELRQERDPEDVAPVARGPRPHKVLAELLSPPGTSWDFPRFTVDGAQLLLTRGVGASNGTVAPDLFLWDWREDQVRRVTFDQSVRQGDPAPSGDWAAAVQCKVGICSLVRVSLRDGSVQMILRGEVNRAYAHPRVAPDGRSIVVARQEGALWRIVLVDVESGAARLVGPEDNNSRFDPAFTADGSGILVVSTDAGVHNLELLDVTSGTSRRITNVVSGAYAPEATPAGDSALFLLLRADGYDLRRVALAATAPRTDVVRTPFGPSGMLAPSLPSGSSPLPPSRPYGPGPQRLFWIPVGAWDAQGGYGGAVLSLGDPVGRISTVLTGSVADARGWRGLSLKSVWRGWPLQIGAHVEMASVSYQLAPSGARQSVAMDFRGGGLFLRREFSYPASSARLDAGVWIGSQEVDNAFSLNRTSAYLGAGWARAFILGATTIVASGGMNGELGESDGNAWRRAIFSAAVDLRTPGPDLRVAASSGRARTGEARSEGFLLGGTVSPHLGSSAWGNLVAAPILGNAIESPDRYTRLRSELSGVAPFTLFGEWFFLDSHSDPYLATGGILLAFNSERTPQIAAPGIVGEIGAGMVLVGSGPRRAVLFAQVRIAP